jgi:hypothetical protein
MIRMNKMFDFTASAGHTPMVACGRDARMPVRPDDPKIPVKEAMP